MAPIKSVYIEDYLGGGFPAQDMEEIAWRLQDIMELRHSFTSTTPVEDTSWGKIKSLYLDN